MQGIHLKFWSHNYGQELHLQVRVFSAWTMIPYTLDPCWLVKKFTYIYENQPFM